MKPFSRIWPFVLGAALTALPHTALAQDEAQTQSATSGFQDLEALWRDPDMPQSWFEAPGLASEMGITTFNQSPMLDERVANGELPPVEERLPVDPAVVEPYENIGTYGGSLVLYGVDLTTDFFQFAGGGIGREGLVRGSPDGTEFVEWIAESVVLLEDNTVAEIKFREGMKWSDGTPFIAADEYEFYFNETLPAVGLDPTQRDPGILGYEVVDDNTVRIQLDRPYPVFMFQFHTAFVPDVLAQTVPMAPAHIMREYLPSIVGEDVALEKARELGFDSVTPMLIALSDQVQTLDEPRFGIPATDAYIPVSKSATELVLERNPYYPFIDTEGNQLPYIDRIVVRFAAQTDNVELQALSGNSDVMVSAARTDRIPVYIENEAQGDYTTYIYQDSAFSKPFYTFNMTPPEREYGEYFEDVRFRRAMSLAINRDQINDRFYFGRALPMQVTISPSHPAFKPEYASAYAEYDPDTARQLLDELGLVDQNGDGFRDFPDGSPFTVQMMYAQEEYLSPIQLHEYTVTNWADVGINVDIQTVSGEVFWQRSGGIQFDMKPHLLDFSIPYPTGFVYFNTPYAEPEIAPFGDYINWFRSGGAEGTEPPADLIDEFTRIYEAAGTYLTTLDDDALTVMLESQAENLWTIGTVGFPPKPVTVANRVHNVPNKLLWDNVLGAEMTMRPYQWYIEE